MEAESASSERADVQTTASDAAVRPDSNDTATVAEAAVDESLWVRKWDDNTNQLYYFNLRTQESSWEEPRAYKAVLMSKPLDMDTEIAADTVEAVEKPTEDPQQQSNATVAIQSLFRGRKDRKKVKEARKWTEQYDPTSAHKYYYNSETGESQWEKPADLLTGVRDERSDRAVKIQSLFRAKKARDRVKQLADEEEEEEELKQQLREEEAAVAAEEEKMAALAAVPTAKAQWCEFFDPRSRKYYYRHAVSGAIMWEKPDEYVSSSCVEGSERDRAALSIQCAARKRIAAKDVAAKREKLRALTDPITMQRKLGELKEVAVEIEAEIDGRTLVSAEEEQQFPHLASLLTGWRVSLESIKNHVISLENRGEDIQLADSLAARLVHAERFHKALADMRSEYLALLRSILLMNSYFVDLDVSRINAGCATFAKWKSHELCALRDSRLLESIQGSDISQLLEHAEVLLQRSMGLTDFSNGSTSATGKRYEDWHPSVAAALVGVRELEEGLAKKTQLLRGYRAAEVRKRENYQMAEEDLLASRIAQIRQRRMNDEVDYAAFLVKCQEYWQKGLNQREDELQAGRAPSSSKNHKQTRHMSPQGDPTNDSDDNNTNLSIWEATKEGAPVEVVLSIISEEMQKVSRRGNDFLVKSARSDHGETLIEIACWWGHEHLVKFYLEEGAQIHGIDSTCNRFSLLHDAARRGHSRVIRVLLEHGLSCKVTDSAGDTPLHWAARRNNYSAVLTLLGVYSSNRDKTQTDEIVKAVRQKNLRGKTATTLAKNDRVRDVLKAAEEGRLPPLRRPRTSKPASVGSMLDTNELVSL